MVQKIIVERIKITLTEINSCSVRNTQRHFRNVRQDRQNDQIE